MSNEFIGVGVVIKATTTETEARAAGFWSTREEHSVRPLPYRLCVKLGAVFAHLFDGVPTLATGL